MLIFYATTTSGHVFLLYIAYIKMECHLIRDLIE